MRSSALVLAVLLAGSSANATIDFAFLSPSLHDPDSASMDANLGVAGLAIEDFEDSGLLDGFTLTINNDHAAAAAQNGTYTNQDVFITREHATNQWHWDQKGVVFVEHGTVSVAFDDPVSVFGIGIGGYLNGPGGMTFTVNGSTSATGSQVSGAYIDDNTGRNTYLLITASGGQLIDTVSLDIRIPPSDGGALDHMAFGTVPGPGLVPLVGLSLAGLLWAHRRSKTPPAGSHGCGPHDSTGS